MLRVEASANSTSDNSVIDTRVIEDTRTLLDERKSLFERQSARWKDDQASLISEAPATS